MTPPSSGRRTRATVAAANGLHAAAGALRITADRLDQTAIRLAFSRAARARKGGPS